MSNKNQPLIVKITKDGVLTIEIGVETLAFAALRSNFAYSCADEFCRIDPRDKFEISDSYGFATDVCSELQDEAEDGSTLLTVLFDQACSKAIEQGSEFFQDK